MERLHREFGNKTKQMESLSPQEAVADLVTVIGTKDAARFIKEMSQILAVQAKNRMIEAETELKQIVDILKVTV